MSKKEKDNFDLLDDEELVTGLFDGKKDEVRFTTTQHRKNESTKAVEQFGQTFEKTAFVELPTEMSMADSCRVVLFLAVPPIISSFFLMFV